MPKITFIEPNGEHQTIEAQNNETLMKTAKYNGVEGILAECGGSCACATCHVFIDEAYLGKIPPAGEYELEMLEDTHTPRQPNSRLSCQIHISDELDGMVVNIATNQ